MSEQNDRGTARINGNRLYYEDHGRGTPLVFIHGAFNTSDMWRPQIESLSRRHRVIVYDLPGHGRSGPTQLRFSMADLARDLDGLLDHLDAAPAVVCGFSIGGCVVQEYAARHPEKLRGMIISDSIGDSLAGPLKRFAGGLFRFSAPFVSRRRILDLATLATNAMQKDVQRYHREIARKNLARMSKREIFGIARSLIEFRERDLSRFDKPALILAGVKEPAAILKEARRLVRRLPRATLELIENAQHGPNRENAPAFDAAIERLMTAIDDAATRAA